MWFIIRYKITQKCKIKAVSKMMKEGCKIEVEKCWQVLKMKSDLRLLTEVA